MFFVGVDQAELAALGPGTLLVLALPAWYGRLYRSPAKTQPDCCIRMLGPPLLHSLPPDLGEKCCRPAIDVPCLPTLSACRPGLACA